MSWLGLWRLTSTFSFRLICWSKSSSVLLSPLLYLILSSLVFLSSNLFAFVSFNLYFSFYRFSSFHLSCSLYLSLRSFYFPFLHSLSFALHFSLPVIPVTSSPLSPNLCSLFVSFSPPSQHLSWLLTASSAYISLPNELINHTWEV
ncbi:hypothetical protein XENOCAPTIV_012810 [Xenoophorus captivus]|uniref:Uncharacterized protein n=1 Tax=Xenoophorus captivus TaxID=1517983 RepID=A0ABV0Q9M9_9TELE